MRKLLLRMGLVSAGVWREQAVSISSAYALVNDDPGIVARFFFEKWLARSGSEWLLSLF